MVVVVWWYGDALLPWNIDDFLFIDVMNFALYQEIVSESSYGIQLSTHELKLKRYCVLQHDKHKSKFMSK